MAWHGWRDMVWRGWHGVRVRRTCVMRCAKPKAGWQHIYVLQWMSVRHNTYAVRQHLFILNEGYGSVNGCAHLGDGGGSAAFRSNNHVADHRHKHAAATIVAAGCWVWLIKLEFVI